ncbi:MAG: pyridoxamine 5'-phosphate oxidase family protein [Polyangiales bacterium]
MAELTLAELSQKMRKIDFAMLSTHTEGEQIAARPMSNNGDVEYKGDSYYFTWEQSRTVRDIERNPKVSLSFQGAKKPLMIAVEGQAELIRDKAEFEAHWTKDLDRWFDDGVDSEGLVLIKVQATRIHYWDGEDEGELTVS